MAGEASNVWNGFKNRFSNFRGFMVRLHRVLGPLWLISLAVGTAIDTSQIPGPSIPAILFISMLITGGYLNARPWVRGPHTPTERLKRLTQWTWNLPVVIRRTHRMSGSLFLLILAVALVVTFAGGNPNLILVPLVAVLFYSAITGLYLFFSPWVARFRSA